MTFPMPVPGFCLPSSACRLPSGLVTRRFDDDRLGHTQQKRATSLTAAIGLPNEGKSSRVAALRALLARDGILKMPCCFDALSARLIERAGFQLTFMSGFSTAAAKVRRIGEEGSILVVV